MGRKHCGKRRNCSLRAISPFSTVFSKDFYCRHVKTRACLGKGSNKSTACGCQRSAVGCLIEVKKLKSKKGHISENKMHFEYSLLILRIAF